MIGRQHSPILLVSVSLESLALTGAESLLRSWVIEPTNEKKVRFLVKTIVIDS